MSNVSRNRIGNRIACSPSIYACQFLVELRKTANQLNTLSTEALKNRSKFQNENHLCYKAPHGIESIFVERSASSLVKLL